MGTGEGRGGVATRGYAGCFLPNRKTGFISHPLRFDLTRPVIGTSLDGADRVSTSTFLTFRQ